MNNSSKSFIRFKALIAILLFLFLFWAPLITGFVNPILGQKGSVWDEYEEWFDALRIAWAAFVEGEMQ